VVNGKGGAGAIQLTCSSNQSLLLSTAADTLFRTQEILINLDSDGDIPAFSTVFCHPSPSFFSLLTFFLVIHASESPVAG